MNTIQILNNLGTALSGWKDKFFIVLIAYGIINIKTIKASHTMMMMCRPRWNKNQLLLFYVMIIQNVGSKSFFGPYLYMWWDYGQ